MPLVEAMMSHTPVVATRGGAFPEIVEDGRSGLLVERSDVQSLANAILQLLSNPDQCHAMAQAADEPAFEVEPGGLVPTRDITVHEGPTPSAASFNTKVTPAPVAGRCSGRRSVHRRNAKVGRNNGNCKRQRQREHSSPAVRQLAK